MLHLADVLRGLSKETEAEFLSIGEKLCNFSVSCSENSSMASSIVHNIETGSGFNASSLKELFTLVYSEINNTAHIISEGTSGISFLLENLTKIMELQQFLKKLSRSITIIGTLTRIEAARVRHSDFNVMTDVVDSLAKQISKGTEDMKHSVKNARLKIDNINDKLAPSAGLCVNELGKAKGRVESILVELDQLDMQARWLCERIGNRSEEITPEIGEVVTAIQFHDITRQQIEHVCEALCEIEGKFEIYPLEDERGKIILLKWIMEALKIQVEQLNSVLTETHKAIEGISKPLARVSELSEAQAEDAALMLNEEESGKDKIKMIGVALDALVHILTEINEMTTGMVEGTEEAGTHLEGMTGQVKSVEDISDNINILALNAIIKAAHTGSEGRGLGVLAHEISKLSSTAKERIAEGARFINNVLKTSDDFRNSLSLNLKIQIDTSNLVAERARESIEELVRSEDYMMDTLHDISEKTRKLKNEIEIVIAGITFENVIGERINGVIGGIQKLIFEVAEIIPPHAIDHVDFTPDLNELLKRYTMESERIVHVAAVTCENKLSETDEVDMWGTIGESKSGNDDGLGDNIELF